MVTCTKTLFVISVRKQIYKNNLCAHTNLFFLFNLFIFLERTLGIKKLIFDSLLECPGKTNGLIL